MCVPLFHAETIASKWRFANMGVPGYIFHFKRIFHCKPSILGYPHDLGPPQISPGLPDAPGCEACWASPRKIPRSLGEAGGP